ncbi:chitinase-like protein 2 [Mercurialis annua]|uniref:chitinase-like protein 2 n=1 Tax=Mercurialis annua TaxID=3986 RepID=UPI00215FE2B2|nr:chitinase-like protein 2 [Mercurialis annua]
MENQGKCVIFIAALLLGSWCLLANGDDSEKTRVRSVRGKKECIRGWECKQWSEYCCNQTISDLFQTYQFEDLFSKRNAGCSCCWVLGLPVFYCCIDSFSASWVLYYWRQAYADEGTGCVFRTCRQQNFLLKVLDGYCSWKLIMVGVSNYTNNCGYGVATGGPLTYGLCYNKEMSPSQSYCGDYYKLTYPCTPGAEYYGRGALPIYCSFLVEVDEQFFVAKTANTLLGGNNLQQGLLYVVRISDYICYFD